MPESVSPTRPYLEGLYAPVDREETTARLPMAGTLPEGLEGVFVQNGPNPVFPPGVGHSWFDGDGMLHAVELRDGEAAYRNRWVRTPGLAKDRAAGLATTVGSNAPPGAGARGKNVANTDIVFHAGRLLALWWGCGEPWEVSLADLETVGSFDYDGTLPRGMTSHVKLDPHTGELCFFTWGPKPPFLAFGVASGAGRVTRLSPVELPGPRVQHDLAITRRFAIVFDMPLRPDPRTPNGDQISFRFDRDAPCRFGLVSRSEPEAPVRWFDVAPCWMWHTMCARDEGDEVVLVGVRIADPTRLDAAGRSRRDRPLVDDEFRFETALHEWRLNLATGAVAERTLDDRPVEFPRVSDVHVAGGARTGYAGTIVPDAPTLLVDGFARFDLRSGEATWMSLPRGCFANEACFAPAANARDEDDGYLLTFVTDLAESRSELWILDARSVSSGPVARIALPQRVPAGFHTRWIPRHAFEGATR